MAFIWLENLLERSLYIFPEKYTIDVDQKVLAELKDLKQNVTEIQDKSWTDSQIYLLVRGNSLNVCKLDNGNIMITDIHEIFQRLNWDRKLFYVSLKTAYGCDLPEHSSGWAQIAILCWVEQFIWQNIHLTKMVPYLSGPRLLQAWKNLLKYSKSSPSFPMVTSGFFGKPSIKRIIAYIKHHKILVKRSWFENLLKLWRNHKSSENEWTHFVCDLLKFETLEFAMIVLHVMGTVLTKPRTIYCIFDQTIRSKHFDKTRLFAHILLAQTLTVFPGAVDYETCPKDVAITSFYNINNIDLITNETIDPLLYVIIKNIL
jgi:hypothetical protein